tara:strand:- start:10058 stop:11113 length:1056 start_codon:yes stop_codon:yes gene_type:complete
MDQPKVTKKGRAQTILVSLACIVIIIAGMRAAQSIIIPFLLSIFIATISNPLVLFLQKKHLPKSLSVFFVFLIMVGFGFGITTLLSNSLNEFSSNFPNYQILLKNYAENFFSFLEQNGISVSGKIILEQLDPGSLVSLTSGVLSGLGNVLTKTLLIILMVVFMLMESKIFKQKLKLIFGGTGGRNDQLKSFSNTVKRYMLIKTAISLTTGALATLWLIILDINYPFLWGFLTFLLNYIPTIGSNIAAVPPMLMALIQFDLITLLFVTLGYLVINNLLGSFLEPRILGKGLGLSTLVVFLSLLFWGWLFGPIGMILCIPITTIIKIAFANTKNTRWVSTLLEASASPPLENN